MSTEDRKRIDAEKVRQYWEERAREFAGNPDATTNDVYLRELEARTLVEQLQALDLPDGAEVLDVGCGNGYTLLIIAEHFEKLRFVGMDYSAAMIESAATLLAGRPNLKNRVSFMVGDVTRLNEFIGDRLFDCIMSDRCLINLASFEVQSEAIGSLSKHLKAGGHFVAIENFMEGQRELNEARAALGLPEIPVRWHNIFFNEDEFVEVCQKHFTDVRIHEFASSYYFATRVIYSGMCRMQGVEPDYRHEIHQLAVKLPVSGRFCPIRMAVMKLK